MSEGTEPAKESTAGGQIPPAPAPTGTAPEPKPAEPKVEPKKEGTEGEPKAVELKLPENSLLEAGDVVRIASEAKEQKLTQEQAQALLERESKIVSSYEQRQQDVVKKTHETWVTEAKSDKEIGGIKFPENLALAQRVLNRFGTDALKQALTDTGLGNHPEVVRVFARIGMNMSEDKLVLPGPSAPAKKTLEEVFYPKAEVKEA